MDLALNNLQRLICHKPKQPTNDHSGPGSNGNEEVLHIPQNSGITGTLPSDCLVSYPGHSLGEGGVLTSLQRSSWYILQPKVTGQVNTKDVTLAQFCLFPKILHLYAPPKNVFFTFLQNFFESNIFSHNILVK